MLTAVKLTLPAQRQEAAAKCRDAWRLLGSCRWIPGTLQGSCYLVLENPELNPSVSLQVISCEFLVLLGSELSNCRTNSSVPQCLVSVLL